MTTVQETTRPQTSLDQALDLWLTVPKRQPEARERKVLAQADNFTLPFGKVNLAVSAWGSGQPVILIHGWGGNRGQLSAFAAPLVAANYRAVAFDAPAHGDTPGVRTTGFNFEAALETVIEQVGEPHAILAHSFGTLVVSIALQKGVQVDKLVFFGAMRRLSDAFRAFSQATGLAPEAQQHLYQQMKASYGEDVWEVTALDKQLPRFAVPTLMFHDREDEITPYQSSAALAKAWPAARLVTTNGLGHRRILRDPQVIQQAVDFVTS
jgi:pimeloyl-ACP methyl ester carboxylesterase